MSKLLRKTTDICHGLLIVASLILLFQAKSVFASQTYKDIVVSTEESQGQSYHGYAEYKVTITNNNQNQSHEVSLVMPEQTYGSGDYLSKLTRTVVVGPQSTVQVPLLQPPIPINGRGLRVIIDGRKQKEKIWLKNFEHCSSGSGYGYYGGPTMKRLCILLSRQVVMDDFQNGIQNALAKEEKSGSTSPFGRGRSSSPNPSEYCHFIKSESQVSDWSENWLVYTRYDGIVMTAQDIQSMPQAVRATLLKYVQCGGTLLVLGHWKRQTSDVKKFQPETFTLLVTDIWQSSCDYIQSQQEKNASEIAEVFPVIPNLGIPIRGLFALVIIFAVVIGPVNLVLLSRKKKKIWMLWTVPLISITGSISVFAFALFSEGWRGYARTDSVTILDQANNQAATIATAGFYCPLTPGKGLHFEYETEVTPLGLQRWNSGRPREIDWTLDQHLSRGWIPARVQTHFLIRKNQTRRERLNVVHLDDQVSAVNGLGADISVLWYADDKGRVYQAEDVNAGAKKQLKLTDYFVSGQDPYPEFRRSFKNWTRLYQQISTNPKKFLKHNCYIAVLKDSVFIEKPLDNLKSEEYNSVVIGVMKDPADAG